MEACQLRKTDQLAKSHHSGSGDHTRSADQSCDLGAIGPKLDQIENIESSVSENMDKLSLWQDVLFVHECNICKFSQ